MSEATVLSRPQRSMTLFTQGFRPFFLAAGLWAAFALSLWIVMLDTGMRLPSRFAPLSWHIHEMLFGFVMAAVAGFLLTAIPNWTRRLPVSGLPLAGLAALWLLARICCLISQWLPPWLAVSADLAFPLALAAVVAREIIAAHDRRNMPVIMPVIVLGIANLLMDLEAIHVAVPAGLGWRLGLAAILVLVSVIAGRIVPGFTRNWLALRHSTSLPAKPGAADRIALGTLHAGLFAWAFFPLLPEAGGLLILGAIANLWRLSRWQGAQTLAEPLLIILHIAYGWLCIGALLLGASVLTTSVPLSAGIHAMTVGAIGTMILAVMTRATRGHTGQPLAADRTTTLLYACVIAAAIVRVAAAFASVWTMQLLAIAAGFWVLAFVIFVVRYAPLLCRPRDRAMLRSR
ncbi:MAG: NnrS family protein [Alphaproteobacteria bacterium]|nr:NnrS family protein [Alphaproteobacteria bacterium]